MLILGIEPFSSQSLPDFTHKVYYSEPETTGNAEDYCLVKGGTPHEALIEFFKKRVVRIQDGEPIFPFRVEY